MFGRFTCPACVRAETRPPEVGGDPEAPGTMYRRTRSAARLRELDGPDGVMPHTRDEHCRLSQGPLLEVGAIPVDETEEGIQDVRDLEAGEPLVVEVDPDEAKKDGEVRRLSARRVDPAKRERETSTIIGQVILADMCGPWPVSHDGDRYGCIMYDEASKAHMYWPLSTKVAAGCIEAVSLFRSLLEAPKGGWFLLTDCGGEFKGKYWTDHLSETGGVHRTGIPYRSGGRTENIAVS